MSSWLGHKTIFFDASIWTRLKTSSDQKPFDIAQKMQCRIHTLEINIHPYAQFIGVQHPPTDERYSFAQSLVYAAARILELVHHTYNLWAGKKIKTKSGKKSLPIHQGLIQLFVWETAIWQNTFYREENRKKFAISPLSLLFASFNMVHWRWSMPATTSETRTLNKVRYYFFCSFVRSTERNWTRKLYIQSKLKAHKNPNFMAACASASQMRVATLCFGSDFISLHISLCHCVWNSFIFFLPRLLHVLHATPWNLYS